MIEYMEFDQLKHFVGFNLFEIETMTAEERDFYLKWYADMKTKENEAKAASNAPSSTEPKFGPAT